MLSSAAAPLSPGEVGHVPGPILAEERAQRGGRLAAGPTPRQEQTHHVTENGTAELAADGQGVADAQDDSTYTPQKTQFFHEAAPTVDVASAAADATNVSLFVGDLEESVTEALIYNCFSTVAPVVSVRLCRDAVTRRSLGYAYVNFPTHEDGKRALEQLNYCVVQNRPWRVMWSQRDPSLRKRGAGNIFIKNLPSDVGPKELHDLYSNFGTILSLKVAQENGVSKGYAFVHYETAEQAETAISKTDGLLFNDQKVYVCHHMSRRERHSCTEQSMARFTNVYVKNLPSEVTDDAFREKFASFGEITSSIVMRYPESGRPKGFGFVNYKAHEAAREAVAEINGLEWDGRRLYVGRALSRAERAEEVRRKFNQLREERYAANRGLNVYVKNLGDEIEDARLASEFSQFGIVTSAKVMTTEGGRTRGFGFVCFSSAEEATRAITEMNGKMLCGKPLYVSLAQRKEERRAQLRTMMSLRESRPFAQTLETGNSLTTNGFYSSSGLFYPPSPAYSPTVVAAPPGVRYATDPSVRWGGGLQQPQGVPPGSSLLFPAYGPQIPVVQPAVFSPPQYSVNGTAQHQRRTSRGHLAQQAQQQPRGQQLQLRTPQPVAARPGLGAGVADVGIRPPHVVSQNNRRTGAYPPGSRNLLRYTRPAAAREAAFGSADPQLPPRRNSAEQHAAMQAPLSAAAHHPVPHHPASSAPYAPVRGLPTTISARKLAEIPPDQQKQLLGEHLYGNVQHALRSSTVVGSGDLLRLPPGEGQDGAADDGDRAAGKITGMLLEMETGEILHLLESPPALYQKVHEAVNVLREASGRQGALHPGAS